MGKPRVNQSLLRIQETIRLRNEKKIELQKPVEVVAVDLPSFDFQILSSGKNIGFGESESESDDGYSNLFGSDTESVSSGASDDGYGASWLASFNEDREEAIKQEKERYLREEKERKEER